VPVASLFSAWFKNSVVPDFASVPCDKAEKRKRTRGNGRTHEVRRELVLGHANTVVCTPSSQTRAKIVQQTGAPLMMIRPPLPSSSGTALMVIFSSPLPSQSSFSVSAVRRSFSRASFAFEISSRKKTSLSNT
jgi:hypothetical protein